MAKGLRILSLAGALAILGWWVLIGIAHIGRLNSMIIGLLIGLMAGTGWAQWAIEQNDKKTILSAGAPERPPDGLG